MFLQGHELRNSKPLACVACCDNTCDWFQMWDFMFSASFKEEFYQCTSDDLDLRCQEFPCKHGYTIWAADSEVACSKQCALYVSPPVIVCQLSTSYPRPCRFPPAVRQLWVSLSGEFYLQLNSAPSPVVASGTGRAPFIHYATGKFQVPALRLRYFQAHSSNMSLHGAANSRTKKDLDLFLCSLFSYQRKDVYGCQNICLKQ